MAFWFGITSMIRPIGVECIPASRILASTKPAITSLQQQSQTQELPQTSFHRKTSSKPAVPFGPCIMGVNAGNFTASIDQYLFLRCSGDHGHSPVSRAMQKERDWSTYCITGTEYEWMPESMQHTGHRWKRS